MRTAKPKRRAKPKRDQQRTLFDKAEPKPMKTWRRPSLTYEEREAALLAFVLPDRIDPELERRVFGT